MKSSFKLRPLAAGIAGGACLALTPNFGAAQSQPSSPAPSDTTLPEVKVKESVPGPDYNPPIATVGGGVPTPIRDIPQSVTGDQQRADAGTRRDESRRRAAQCPGDHARRRGRRQHRQQLQPARLQRAYRSLPRRDARSRSVLSRRLLARRSRSPAGTLVDALRPRLDRRHHQPGQQAPEPRAVGKRAALGRNAADGPRHGRLQPADRRHVGVSHRGDGAGRPFDARRDGEPRLRARAVAALRHRHGDRSDVERAADALPRPARLRSAARQRRAGRGRPQEILRRDRRPDRAGRRQPQRNDPAPIRQ